MAAGDTPDSIALALGKLIGTVDGLSQTLKDQNTSAANNRNEFIKIFEGMRQDSKDAANVMASHIKEDNLHHQALLELMTWKKDAEPKVNDLYDNKNIAKGAVWASGLFGTFLGGAIVALLQWLHK